MCVMYTVYTVKMKCSALFGATLYCQTVLFTEWAKKVSYGTVFSIFSLNIDQFSQFFTSRLWKKYPTRWHAHHAIMLLHYLVKYKYLKTYNIYRW